MLCTSKLAPTSSIKDMAICVATKIFRIRVAVFPAIAERPPCFNASTRFTRVPVSAGAKPNSKAVASETASVNASTRQSMATDASCGIASTCIFVTLTSAALASSNPAAEPSNDSSKVSASSWRINPPRAEPSAARNASSRCRAEFRTSNKFARFTQAISKIKPTAPISRNSMGRSDPARVSSNFFSTTLTPWSTGCAAANASATTVRSACACATVTPGFMRPSARYPRSPRALSAHASENANGVQISSESSRPASTHSGATSGITATMV